MYRVIGAKIFVGYFALAILALGLTVVFVALTSGVDLATALRISRWIAGSIAAIVLGLGSWPAAFDGLSKKTPLGRIFPPISGEWQMSLESNWDAIAERSGLEKSLPRPLEGTATITATLFGISMLYETDDRYTNSRTVSAQVLRDPENGRLQLAYVYDAKTPDPKLNDSGGHYGAGLLDYCPTDTGGPTFRGNYWTNRNWRRGLNTAGTATLTRKNNWSG